MKIGIALSGGGSRAAAFHLGCMRALNDRNILENISVISTVSGGSLIGALWAYSEEDFNDFDKNMQKILQTGLRNGIIRYTLFSRITPIIALTILTSGVLAVLFSVFRILGLSNFALFGNFFVPPPRFASRTTAFYLFLEKEIFGKINLEDIKRKNLQAVINATELRTQSAFRYGSLKSGCWRFGTLANNATVAKAVAASAAFPVFLPAIDEYQIFEQKGKKKKERTIISDGGIYDNLGTSCLLPNRNKSISTNVHDVDFIIACVAGAGIPDGSQLSYFWPSRMKSAMETTHRRTDSLAMNLLHRLADKREIKGFIMPYLGQQDEKLPHRPVDLVPRTATYDYPTDFNPMSRKMLDLLSKRGEQLTHALIEAYYPDL